MTVIAIVPAVVALVGLLMFLLLQGKGSQVGLYMFGAGLLVTCFAVAGHVVRL